MAYAHTRVRTIGMQTACKTASASLGMSASHSPTIGSKPHQPIELLTNTEQCDFGRGFKLLHLIVTKLFTWV